nr:nuclear RNA polymerase D1B [Tanacetum cinerariifolium]
MEHEGGTKKDRGGWKKKDGWVPKRDHFARPVGGPNDGRRPGGPFTTPKQSYEIFTANGQEILNEIKPIIQCTRRVMHQIGSELPGLYTGIRNENKGEVKVPEWYILIRHGKRVKEALLDSVCRSTIVCGKAYGSFSVLHKHDSATTIRSAPNSRKSIKRITSVLACHSRCKSAEAVSKKKIKRKAHNESSDMDAQTKQEKEPRFRKSALQIVAANLLSAFHIVDDIASTFLNRLKGYGCLALKLRFLKGIAVTFHIFRGALHKVSWKLGLVIKGVLQVNEARDPVMSSDEASFGVTYTSISSNYEEPSDVGSPGVVVYGYDGLPMHPVDPPSPDYPYDVADSPIALSSGCIAKSDPEEDSKDESEDGPTDYPTDGGDGDEDDDDDRSFDDDEEEEEHLASIDLVIAPTVDHVPSSEETAAPIPSLSEAEVERLLALPTSPPSPLISLSPPSVKERLARCLAAPAHPSPPLPPLPSSLYLPSPVLISLPLPSPPLPLLPALLFIPPPVDRTEDIPEVELPPRKRLCLTAPTSRYDVGESSTASRPTGGHRADYGFIGTLDAETRRQRAEEVGYGIRDVWVDPTEDVEEVAPTTLEGVNDKVTELAEVHEVDTQAIYAVIEDAQDRQTRLSQRVDVLIEDKEFHQETVLLMEHEALVSRKD